MRFGKKTLRKDFKMWITTPSKRNVNVGHLVCRKGLNEEGLEAILKYTFKTQKINIVR